MNQRQLYQWVKKTSKTWEESVATFGKMWWYLVEEWRVHRAARSQNCGVCGWAKRESTPTVTTLSAAEQSPL